MLFVLLTVAVLLVLFGPMLWVKFQMRRYSTEIEGMPGTGGELAEHLIARFDIKGVCVERLSEGGDHYSPQDKAVRLSASNYDGKSLTAIAVAAHEVGHALQFDRGEQVSQLRERYIPTAMTLKRVGIATMGLVPLVLLFKAPAVLWLLVFVGLGFQLLGALAYLIVLPEEWDASFNKALPILTSGDYIRPQDEPAVRSVLTAAALTYFAGALADLLNIGRWLVILLRR
ncbi:MAG: zinc metallopeptidase [Pseudomonadaceae bacterium]|nr:zinc metallopeptidase [Pseudomonadaceae bacterium]